MNYITAVFSSSYIPYQTQYKFDTRLTFGKHGPWCISVINKTSSLAYGHTTVNMPHLIKKLHNELFCFCFFLTMPHSMGDFSSPTRDWPLLQWKHWVLMTRWNTWEVTVFLLFLPTLNSINMVYFFHYTNGK